MKESAYTEMLEKMTKQELLEEYQKVFKEPCIDSNSRTDIIEDIKGAWRHFRERLAITKVIYNSNSWLEVLEANKKSKNFLFFYKKWY